MIAHFAPLGADYAAVVMPCERFLDQAMLVANPIIA
jgi:hypothetical protein